MSMTLLETQDLVKFVTNGYQSVEQDREAAHAAVQLAAENERDYEAALRSRLLGKLVEVTGYTETTERMTQDGLEHCRHNLRLENTHLVVTGVFLTEDRSTRLDSRTPLVYASRIDENNKRLRGGELSFRLLKAREITIL
jgi:hypothetical protein